MKQTRAKVGAVVLDKVTGNYYMVTEEASDGSIAKAIEDGFDTRTHFLSKDVVLGEKSIKITEANAICFRCILDAPPVAAEGYYAADGVLVKDGNPVTEQGELYISAVFPAVRPGYIILFANSREKGMVDVLSYDVTRDRFHHIFQKMRPDYQLFETEAAYFFVEPASVKEEKQEDGTVVTLLDKKAAIHFLDKASLVSGTLQAPNIFDFSKTKMFGKVLFLEVEKHLRPTEDGPDILVDVSEPYMGAFFFGSGYSTCQEALSSVKTITGCVPYDGLFLKSEEGCQLLDPNGEDADIRIMSRKAIAQTAGYDYLVDVNATDGKIVLTLANESMDAICIESKTTFDRGTVVKVYPFLR